MPVKENTLQKFLEQIQINQLDQPDHFCKKMLKWPCPVILALKSVITDFNPGWHDVGKQEKCSSLEPPWENFYNAQ